MIGVPGTAKRLFSCLSDAGISVVLITQASSEHSICFAINDKDSKRIESVVREEFLVDFQNGNLQKQDARKYLYGLMYPFTLDIEFYTYNPPTIKSKQSPFAMRVL